MKPLFNVLKRNHSLMEHLPAEDLNTELGHKPEDEVQTAPDNSAIRMSLALMKCGLAITGRIGIVAGPNAGRSVEPRAKRLADQLGQPRLLGQPQAIAPREALAQLSGKRGIVFFSKPQLQDGGHIDLVEPATAAGICYAASQFPTQEIRFWPLA